MRRKNTIHMNSMNTTKFKVAGNSVMTPTFNKKRKEVLIKKPISYDIHFLVQDEDKRPLKNIPYKITLENGKSIQGKTDVNGLTEKISNDSPMIATLEAPYYGNSTHNSDTKFHQHDTCQC